MLHQSVHARYADGRDQSPDGGGNQANQQRHEDDRRWRRIRQGGEGRQSHGDHQEHDAERDEEDVQGDLVRGLLPDSALNQLDHPVDEGCSRFGSNTHHDPVGEDLGAACDRRAVASGLPDHGRRFAGDGGFVHTGQSFNDFAVGGDDIPGLADDYVVQLQVRSRYLR